MACFLGVRTTKNTGEHTGLTNLGRLLLPVDRYGQYILVVPALNPRQSGQSRGQPAASMPESIPRTVRPRAFLSLCHAGSERVKFPLERTSRQERNANVRLRSWLVRMLFI